MHLHWKVKRIDLTYPIATQLHIDKQVIRFVEGELSLLIGFYTRIRKSAAIVHIEHNTVRIHLDGIYIVIIRTNGSCISLRRIVPDIQMLGIDRMHRLIDYGIVIQPFQCFFSPS